MLTPTEKHAIRKAFRMYRDRPTPRVAAIHTTINDRAYWRDAFDYYAEDGQVVVCRSGMDCDCTQYASRHRIAVPVSIVAWWKDEEEHRAYLDGPESMWLERPEPDHEDTYRSADRALEAYENGHPGTVYWGDL
jgi:hypothetical protein